MRPCHLVLAGFSFFMIAVTLTADLGYGADFLGMLSAVPLGMGDKIGHALLFGLLALLANLASRKQGFSLPATLLVTAVACADEASQYFLPYRHFDAFDLAAGLAGIAAAAVISAAIARAHAANERRKIDFRQAPPTPLDWAACRGIGDESHLCSTRPQPAGTPDDQPAARFAPRRSRSRSRSRTRARLRRRGEQ